MSKRIVFISLLLIACSTTCGPRASLAPPSMPVTAAPTLEPTARPRSTSIPKASNAPIASATPTFTTDRIHWLTWAVEEDVVNATILGDGLEKVEIKLESNVDMTIDVFILPGTLFEPVSPSVQTMVAREYSEIILEPFVEVSFEIEVACADMSLEPPGPGESFAAREPMNPSLTRLVGTKSFLDEDSFRVQQFAVWIITNNPPVGGFVRLGSFGFGSGPSIDEVMRIRQLFEEAGIATSEYAAFG